MTGEYFCPVSTLSVGRSVTGQKAGSGVWILSNVGGGVKALSKVGVGV